MKSLFILLITLSFSTQASSIRVITVKEPPSSFIADTGRANGYAVDIFRLLVKNTQLENAFNIEFVPEARVLNIAEQKANVVFFAFSRTALREDKFHWIGAVASKKWQVYALKYANISINTLSQLKQFPMIGVVRGDVREELLIDRGFSNLNSVTQHEQNVKLLLMGRIPVIAFEQQGLTFIMNKLGENIDLITPEFTLNTSETFIAMSRKGTDMTIVKRLTDRYKEIQQDGSLLLLSQKWKISLEQNYKISSVIENGLLSF